MRSSVRLTVVPPAGRPQLYTFSERTTCLVGRAADCDPRIREESRRPLTSRHHCLLDINPPDVRVRDLGSLNGTHVNGLEIGRRQAGMTPEQGARLRFREHDLADGDEVRIGRTTIRVRIDRPRLRATRRQCAWCLADLDAAPARDGDLVCDACRGEPRRIAQGLLTRPFDDDAALRRVAGYVVDREIGLGGQGAVYLARDPDTGRRAALKVLLPQVAVSAAARDRFLREVAITRTLRHPNIVGFLDSGYVDGVFFLASEFCAGGDLQAAYTRHGGPLAVADGVRIAVQVLDGLDFAHSAVIDGDDGHPVRGIVHRDVKPSNVLLSDTGADPTALIADFGIAKAFDNAGLSGHTRTGTVAGTTRFMAREQLVNYRFARPTVDVWAAAATAYWALTGSPPRTFPDTVDPLAVVLGHPPEPLRSRAPSVPGAVAAALDAALSGEGASGPSAAELRAELLGTL